MEALLAELAGEFGESRLFRPYRDTRFSPDKSPYKTAIAARIGDGYVQLSAARPHGRRGHLPHGARPAGALPRRRRRRTGPGASSRPSSTPCARRRSRSPPWRRSRRAPRGYAKDHPRIELLRHKGLVAMKAWPVAGWLGTAGAKKRVVDLFHATAPLLSWLDAHVGAERGGRRHGMKPVIDRRRTDRPEQAPLRPRRRRAPPSSRRRSRAPSTGPGSSCR